MRGPHPASRGTARRHFRAPAGHLGHGDRDDAHAWLAGNCRTRQHTRTPLPVQDKGHPRECLGAPNCRLRSRPAIKRGSTHADSRGAMHSLSQAMNGNPNPDGRDVPVSDSLPVGSHRSARAHHVRVAAGDTDRTRAVAVRPLPRVHGGHHRGGSGTIAAAAHAAGAICRPLLPALRFGDPIRDPGVPGRGTRSPARVHRQGPAACGGAPRCPVQRANGPVQECCARA